MKIHHPDLSSIPLISFISSTLKSYGHQRAHQWNSGQQVQRAD